MKGPKYLATVKLMADGYRVRLFEKTFFNLFWTLRVQTKHVGSALVDIFLRDWEKLHGDNLLILDCRKLKT